MTSANNPYIVRRCARGHRLQRQALLAPAKRVNEGEQPALSNLPRGSSYLSTPMIEGRKAPRPLPLVTKRSNPSSPRKIKPRAPVSKHFGKVRPRPDPAPACGFAHLGQCIAPRPLLGSAH